jgi:putative transposase
MSDKFQNKYRISSARLKNWDYGSNAIYFVSICTQNREHYFGNIEEGKMELSETGKSAQCFWIEIPIHFPFVKLGEFVVMPNHVHGIIIIDKMNGGVVGCNSDCDNGDGAIVETQNFASLQQNVTQNHGNIFGPQSQNLASIIRGYKTGVTKFARNNKIPFSWQPRFYDHIIRNHESFLRISNYIINNPVNWQDDKFFNEKL